MSSSFLLCLLPTSLLFLSFPSHFVPLYFSFLLSLFPFLSCFLSTLYLFVFSTSLFLISFPPRALFLSPLLLQFVSRVSSASPPLFHSFTFFYVTFYPLLHALLSSSSSSLDPHIRAQWVAACCLMQQTCTERSEAALNALVMSFCAAAWALVSLIFQALSHHDDIWSWGGVTLLRQDRRTQMTAAAAQEEVTSFASAEDVSASSLQVTSGWGERKHDTFYADFTLIKLLTQAVQQESEIQY